MKSLDAAPWIHTIPEYVPGRSKEEIARLYGAANPIKLASNENPLGPSPLALQAVRASLSASHLYPDPDAGALRTAAARFFCCPLENIIAGNGSDEIIDLICRAYLSPGDDVIIPFCTFSYYAIASKACGAHVVLSPMRDHRIDVEGITALLSKKTKIIFVANPNNPTGTCLSTEEILGLTRLVPKDVLIAIDEAYAAFTRQGDFMSATRLIADNANLVTTHTLSKSHGLAGLRVGFGIASSHVMKNMLRIKPPFNVNMPAQKAGEAALADVSFLEMTLKITWEGLDMLYAAFDRLGLSYVPSQANFVLVRIGSDASRVYEDLLRRGIITRYITNAGLDDYIRVSIGLPEENRAFIQALEEVL